MEGGPAVGNIERKTNLGSRHCENKVQNLSKTSGTIKGRNCGLGPHAA